MGGTQQTCLAWHGMATERQKGRRQPNPVSGARGERLAGRTTDPLYLFTLFQSPRCQISVHYLHCRGDDQYSAGYIRLFSKTFLFPNRTRLQQLTKSGIIALLILPWLIASCPVLSCKRTIPRYVETRRDRSDIINTSLVSTQHRD